MIISYNQLPSFDELLKPDFENGKLFWKVDRSPKIKAGMEAGSIRDRRGKGKKPKPYCMIQCDGFTNYNRGKILYYLKYGIWPMMIDHINADSLDDRIVNLREITPSKNAWNIEYHSSGKSLPVGVRFSPTDRGRKKYRAVCRYYGRQHSTRAATADEALEKYEKMIHKYYGKDLTLDYYLNVKQGSDLWHFLRQNRITATSAYNLLKTSSATEVLKNLKAQKPFAGNFWTERGKTLEPEAREIYSKVYNSDIHEVGGIINSKYPLVWYSPDGVVGLDGLIEIKCFSVSHHQAVIKAPDPQIIAQMQFGLWLSEREWIDFIAYNPELENPHEAFYRKRFYPDKTIHQKFEDIFSKLKNS